MTGLIDYGGTGGGSGGTLDADSDPYKDDGSTDSTSDTSADFTTTESSTSFDFSGGDDDEDDDTAGDTTDSSDVDRQTYGDITDDDNAAESGQPGAGAPEVDIVSPDPNENTDGDAVGVVDDTAVFDPDQSEREGDQYNELDESKLTTGTEFVDASGEEAETVTTADESGMDVDPKAIAAFVAVVLLMFGG